MELHIWPSDFGLPSVDSRCLQFMACAKFCAAPVSVIPSSSPWKSRNGNYPLFVGKGTPNNIITDFDKFAEMLRKSAQVVVLDGEMTMAEKYEFQAYSSLMIRNFYPAQVYFMWIDQWNFSAITQHWYSKHLPFGYSLYYLEKQRKKAQSYFDACGRPINRILLDAISAINSLSAKLGDNKYFYGDKPSSLDALVFGYLAPMLKIPLPSDRLQQHIKGCSNLVRFIESIISIYLPLTEDQKTEQKNQAEKWDARRRQAKKEADQLNINRKEAVKIETNSTLNDTIFFAVAALTLSVLFAIHCGLIEFKKFDEKESENLETC